MEGLKDFKDMLARLECRNKRWRLALVCAEDESSRIAAQWALERKFVDITFVGGSKIVMSDERLKKYASHWKVVRVESRDEAAHIAVEMARNGEVDILMKGMINTDNLLRAILNKQCGLLLPGAVMTHIALAHMPSYHKMLFFSDSAVIPYPNLQQRIEQVRYIVNLCHGIGMPRPKIALIHCTEKVNGKTFPLTLDYVELKEMAEKGEFGDCIIDGPMDVKTACSAEAMRIKNMTSPINGDADALIMPDIESGNSFYKTITLFAQADTAGILMGTKVPVVLPSRGDDAMSKFFSLALASWSCAAAEKK